MEIGMYIHIDEPYAYINYATYLYVAGSSFGSTYTFANISSMI
jgi:hypothetical protein